MTRMREEETRENAIAAYVRDHVDEAIARGEIRVYYQPLVRALTGKICGVEALARWQSEEYGFLTPNQFIPVLEESDQIYKLDCQVIRQVARRLRQRHESGLPTVPFSVNLSRKDFLYCDMVSVVDRAAKENQIPPSMLCLEITESALAADRETIDRAISRFHRGGYQVWLDDFGSGYSSLNTLKDHNFDVLKIDMAFLSSLTGRSKAIITSIVRMAKKIGIQTLAEGVETEEQYAFLREIGCELLQGYYFSPPMPEEKGSAYVQEKGLQTEKPEDTVFYQKAGAAQFAEDVPMALLEYGDDRIRLLHVSQPFRALGEELDMLAADGLEQRLNNPSNPLSAILRQKIRECRESGRVIYAAFPVNDVLITMDVSLFSQAGDRCICQAVLKNTHISCKGHALALPKETSGNAGEARGKILVVDAETNNAKVLAAILGNEYDVLLADSGRDALEMVQAHGEELDTVILDLQLPDMDGLEVMAQIHEQENGYNIPIIAMSSALNLEKDILRLGANQFLQKPLEAPEVIRNKVAQAIAIAGTNRRLRFNYLDYLPGGVFVYKADGDEEILFANRKTLEIFECSNYHEFLQLTGGTFKGLVYHEDYEKTNDSIWKQIEDTENNKNVDHVIYRVKTAKGNIKELDDFGNLVEDEQLGRLFYVFIGNNQLSSSGKECPLMPQQWHSDSRNIHFTSAELQLGFKALCNIFTVVRLVDVIKDTVISFGEDNQPFPLPKHCFSIWNKTCKCENCVSSRAYTHKSVATKFEFLGDETFFVIAQYVEVDGRPYILECVNHINQEMVERIVSYKAFVKSMRSFNEKLYEDPLTHVKNRRYYEDQLQQAECEAVAMADIDAFKEINDLYGHRIGDEVLRAVAEAIQGSLGSEDVCIHYGGDEFLLAFPVLAEKALPKKLEQIRAEVAAVRLAACPGLQVSVSIGGTRSRGSFNAQLLKAEEALYRARQKKNAVEISD